MTGRNVPAEAQPVGMTARERRTRILQMLQLIPILSVLVILFGGALVMALLQSLGFAPWFGINTFPDFSHFGSLWGSKTFWVSLWLTLYYATVSTLLALVFGTMLALALIKGLPGKVALQVPLQAAADDSLYGRHRAGGHHAQQRRSAFADCRVRRADR